VQKAKVEATNQAREVKLFTERERRNVYGNHFDVLIRRQRVDGITVIGRFGVIETNESVGVSDQGLRQVKGIASNPRKVIIEIAQV
jgi:hypothetical protein